MWFCFCTEVQQYCSDGHFWKINILLKNWIVHLYCVNPNCIRNVMLILNLNSLLGLLDTARCCIPSKQSGSGVQFSFWSIFFPPPFLSTRALVRGPFLLKIMIHFRGSLFMWRVELLQVVNSCWEMEMWAVIVQMSPLVINHCWQICLQINNSNSFGLICARYKSKNLNRQIWLLGSSIYVSPYSLTGLINAVWDEEHTHF